MVRPDYPPRRVRKPHKPIDWDLVDKLLLAGCSGAQIAPHFDMCYDNFYDRVMQEKKMFFTEYRALKKQQGDACLIAKQYEKAMSGDNTMLVWLGKNRLKQKENPVEDTTPEDIKAQFEAMMAATKQLQEALDRNKAEISSNEETKS